MTKDVIKGTPHGDVLVGTQHDDVIEGRGGGDALFGRGGDDNLYGDEGPDVLTGGDGTDTFHFKAGSGIDFVTDLHVKSQGDSVALYGVTEDDISTHFIDAINTTVLTFDDSVITFFGENETDVLSSISFHPADDYLV